MPDRVTDSELGRYPNHALIGRITAPNWLTETVHRALVQRRPHETTTSLSQSPRDPVGHVLSDRRRTQPS